MKRKTICVDGVEYIVANNKYTLEQLEDVIQKMRADKITHFEIAEDYSGASFFAYREETDEEFKKRLGNLTAKKQKLLQQLKDIENLEKTL